MPPTLDELIGQVQLLEATLREMGCELTGIEVASPADESRLKQLADPTRHIAVTEQAMRRQELELCGVRFRNQASRERLERIEGEWLSLNEARTLPSRLVVSRR